MNININDKVNKNFIRTNIEKKLKSLSKTDSKGTKKFLEMLKNDKNYEKKLRKSCIDMESILVKQLLNVMRKTIKKSGFINGGQAEEIFTDMLYGKYANNISKSQSFGLSKVIYNQLSHGKNWSK